MSSHFRKRTFAELSEETTTRRGQLPLVLFLHNIRSQYNVGAIIRTADAVGVERVILSGYTPTPDQPGVKKTALKGLTETKWQYSDDVEGVLKNYKAAGYSIYGLEQCHESKKYTEVKYSFPAVIILGEEVEGIDDGVLQLADQVLEIPMHGKAHSLNVSVASGVLLYEFLRQFSR